jgi:subtilisin-like proprotein convertase family protein
MNRMRVTLIMAFLVLAIVAAGALAPAALAKKKSTKAKTFNASVTVNKPIPDAVNNTTVSTPLTSTITVPKKKYKGKVVGDVNVTGLQTTGSGTGAANDLEASLVAPNGRTIDLFAFIGDVSIGPMTIDDSGTGICYQPPTNICLDGTRTLGPPFAGTANTIWNFAGGFPTDGPLATFDGIPMKGTWTLIVSDQSSGGGSNGTSTLNKWGLQITPAKPPTA